MDTTDQDIFELNKEFWNARTPVHIDSEFYDMPSFLAGKTSLNPIELAFLGDLKGKKVLHLQCHFGQDTLSMARAGAHCTGVDLSDAAIAKARALNTELGLDAQFVNCNVLELDQHLEGKGTFDLVFSSYGTIGWLPDLPKWASLISHFLKPGGKFLLVEFHPTLWMFDDAVKKLKYSYFNRGVLLETTTGSYTENSADLKATSAYFNHGLAETISPLVDQNFTLLNLQEYDWSPYPIFDDNEKYGQGFAPAGVAGIMPLVFALHMQKSV